MIKETIFELPSLYRDSLRVSGYRFGKGTKAACIVGALRGNEVQQLYVCSQLVRTLTELEQRGAIAKEQEILVVPSLNHYAMNIGKRFWAVDNTDINRQFPGSGEGETTQRIAAGVFEKLKHFSYGIHFPSFYMAGDFIPHVRMMDTGYQTSSLAHLFGLPYVVVRKPRPVDTATLNYNWQKWDTNAFSVYTSSTDRIDEPSARQAVSSVLRFLSRMGIIKYQCHSGYIASTIKEDELFTVKTQVPGLFRRVKNPGDGVKRGDVIAEIIHPYEGDVTAKVTSPTEGIIFFAHNGPLVMEDMVVCRIIKRLHE